MDKAKDEAKSSMQEQSRAPRKNRRRKRQYADSMYGARPPHEDARIIDDYATRNEMDRAEVVRLALHQFALRQGMKYQPKDALQEMQEKVFREYFADLFGRLEAISSSLQELPRNGNSPSGEDGSGDTLPPRIESTLHQQKRVLEQVLLASTLTLRLLANYLVEPQLRSLDSSNPASLESHLRAAEAGKSGWSAATAGVMRRTGKQVMDELKLTQPGTKFGTSDAPHNGAHGTAATLTDAEIVAAL